MNKPFDPTHPFDELRNNESGEVTHDQGPSSAPIDKELERLRKESQQVTFTPTETVMHLDLDEVVDQFAAGHQKLRASSTAAAPLHARSNAAVKEDLKHVINTLKSHGINIVQLLPFILQIVSQLFAGTPMAAIIAAILAILQPQPAPTPAPNP